MQVIKQDILDVFGDDQREMIVRRDVWEFTQQVAQIIASAAHVGGRGIDEDTHRQKAQQFRGLGRAVKTTIVLAEGRVFFVDQNQCDGGELFVYNLRAR